MMYFLFQFLLENIAFTNLIFCLADFQASPKSVQCKIDYAIELEMNLHCSWYFYLTILSQSLY